MFTIYTNSCTYIFDIIFVVAADLDVDMSGR